MQKKEKKKTTHHHLPQQGSMAMCGRVRLEEDKAFVCAEQV